MSAIEPICLLGLLFKRVVEVDSMFTQILTIPDNGNQGGKKDIEPLSRMVTNDSDVVEVLIHLDQ